MKKPHQEESHDPRMPDLVTPQIAAGEPVIDSASLLRGHHQILITHGSRTYTLRLTRGDKLILTK